MEEIQLNFMTPQPRAARDSPAPPVWIENLHNFCLRILKRKRNRPKGKKKSQKIESIRRWKLICNQIEMRIRNDCNFGGD